MAEIKSTLEAPTGAVSSLGVAQGEPKPTTAVPVEQPKTETEIDSKREAEIDAFLDEFAHNDARRRVLRKAIEDGTSVENPSKYFQARFKKVQGG